MIKGASRLLEARLVMIDTIMWLLLRVMRRGGRYRLGLMLQSDSILGRLGRFGVGSRSGGCGPCGASS